MKRRVSRKTCVALVAAALVAGTGTDLRAQITEAGTGNITTGNWLILGPFSNSFGCSGINGDQLTLHIAPSYIHCLVPEEGQEVDYDANLASTSGYTGPLGGTGKPVWRIFNDGTPNGDQNFDLDTALASADQTDKVNYIATYVEFLGAQDTEIEICAGSDDGLQVWVDEQMVRNVSYCRGVGDCQDRIPYTISPGFHRIVLGAWERAGGFGARLGLAYPGIGPILEDDPDFVFHGVENPGVTVNCERYERSIQSLSDANACPPITGGSMTVTVQAINVPAGGNVAVNERVTGPVGAGNVSTPGGAVAPTSITDIAQTPINSSFLPTFQDSRIIKVNPTCPAGNGEAIDNGDGSYTISNVGEDIWQTGDSFTFLYNRVQGNFVMTAHVAERSEAPSRWGKHGVMARQDLLTRSRYAFVHDQQDPVVPGDEDQDQTRFAARPTHQGNDNFETTVLLANEHHDYIRLERVGNVVNGYSSLDGTDGSWVLQGSLDWGPTAPPNMLVGLAVTSHSNNCDFPLTITFDEVSLVGTVTPLSLTDYPVGVDIAWSSVSHADLTAGNLRYGINIPTGVASMEGNVGDDPIIGEASRFLPPATTDVGGSLNNPDFEHAHNIGPACSDTSITQPSPGTTVIAGAGNDIWQTGDQFMYAYSTVTGDFSARVTITGREHPFVDRNSDGLNDSRWGKHGIMARQDCSARSRYSFMHDHGADLQDTTRFAARPTHGGGDNFEITPATNCDRGLEPECNHANTLRLDRCGNEFIGFLLDEEGAFGATPGAWVEVGRHDWGPDAPASVEVGLAVTTHNSAGSCNLTTITFQNYQLLPSCDAPVGNISCVENAGGLDVSWTNPPSANTSVEIQVLVNDIPFTTVPGTSTSVSLPGSAFPAGQISEISIVNSSGVAGLCSFPPTVNPFGFVKNWLLLGPLNTIPGAAGAAPPLDFITADFLTDGSTTELDITPRAGDSITPSYSNLASSTGLAATPNRTDINPGDTPTWFEWKDPDDTIDYTDVFNQDLDGNMVYAVTYVKVDTETTVDIGIASDDSFHVLVNGVSPVDGAQSIARGYDAANVVQNVIQDVVLVPGCNIIMVKVFEGGGGHGFRLRLQDDFGTPLIPEIFTDPTCPSGGGAGFRRGDSNASGDLNITDGVFVLNYLFLGGPEPPCQDAADSDDNGQLNITDGVRILNYLFLGGPAPPAPGPDTCGSDPTPDDDLPTCVYTAC